MGQAALPVTEALINQFNFHFDSEYYAFLQPVSVPNACRLGRQVECCAFVFCRFGSMGQAALPVTEALISQFIFHFDSEYYASLQPVSVPNACRLGRQVGCCAFVFWKLVSMGQATRPVTEALINQLNIHFDSEHYVLLELASVPNACWPGRQMGAQAGKSSKRKAIGGKDTPDSPATAQAESPEEQEGERSKARKSANNE